MSRAVDSCVQSCVTGHAARAQRVNAWRAPTLRAFAVQQGHEAGGVPDLWVRDRIIGRALCSVCLG